MAAAEHEDVPAMGSTHRGARVWAAAVLLLALVVRYPLLWVPGFKIDQTYFLVWSEMSQSRGLAEVYAFRTGDGGERWCDYPPGYVYVLRVLADVYRLASGGRSVGPVALALAAEADVPDARLAAGVYKLPAVFADALMGALLVLWLAGRLGVRRAVAVGAIYVLMPAVVHNSAVWGQVDAIPTLLVVASLEMARRGRVPAMAAFATLAMLTKAQAGVMLPLWLPVAVQWSGADPRKLLRVRPNTSVAQASRLCLHRRDGGATRVWGRALSLLGIVTGIVAVMLFPFATALDGVWETYAGAAGRYPYVHLNGFSAWFLGAPLSEPHLAEAAAFYVRDDAPWLLGITARVLGLGALVGAFGAVMLVLWRRRCDERSLFWAGRVLPVAFFVLSTQMHERYLFPALAVWAWSCGGSRRWWTCWILLCLCAAVNVFWAWPGPDGAAWVTACRSGLYVPWLGAAPGVWCGAVTLGILLLTLSGWVDGPRSARRCP